MNLVSSILSAAMRAFFLTRKGQIVTVETVRPVALKKSATIGEIFKHSKFQARVGVDYDNMASVIEKREDGTLPATNAGLPYGEWVVFPILIAHKGAEQVRFSAVNSTVKYPPRYLRADGTEIAASEVEPHALAKEFAERDPLDCFNVKLENIVAAR